MRIRAVIFINIRKFVCFHLNRRNWRAILYYIIFTIIIRLHPTIELANKVANLRNCGSEANTCTKIELCELFSFLTYQFYFGS